MSYFVYKLNPPRPTFAQDMTESKAKLMQEHGTYCSGLADMDLSDFPETIVTWELEETSKNKTRLKLTHTGFTSNDSSQRSLRRLVVLS
jgi:hypothetical protein